MAATVGRLCLRRNDKARAPTGLAKELILSGYGPTIRHRENKRGPRQIEANETKRKLTYEPGENTRLSFGDQFCGHHFCLGTLWKIDCYQTGKSKRTKGGTELGGVRGTWRDYWRSLGRTGALHRALAVLQTAIQRYKTPVFTGAGENSFQNSSLRLLN